MACRKPITYSRVRSFPAIVVACLAVSVVFTGGCSTFGTPKQPVAELAPTESDLPTYKVILANNTGGEPTVYVGHISRPITVHDALVESGAVEKYPGMKIDLARKVPGRNEVLRLEVHYDANEKHVIEDFNYAVHPGDEILVRREDVSALGKALKALGG